MIALLTHEKQSLAFFIQQDRITQQSILLDARMNPRTSGSLIQAYILILENVK